MIKIKSVQLYPTDAAAISEEQEMPTKFMQSLDPHVYSELRRIANDRGITMQELIRAVIVPDWMRKEEAPPAQSTRRSRTAHEAVKRARTRTRITA